MNDRVTHYLTEALWNAERRATYDPDCNCDGYFVLKMFSDELRRPPFTLNPDHEQNHSDAFKDSMRRCFHAAFEVIELRELLNT